ncbi:MAG: helix-turn-helix domain-containing protein [Bacteroidales bacterium]
MTTTIKISPWVVVGTIAPKPTSRLDLAKVAQIVGSVMNISTRDMLRKTRQREICEARQTTMYFAVKYARNIATGSNTLAQIGAYFGKNHATVLHSCRVIASQEEVSPIFRKTYREIDLRIKLEIE